jgi:hypothetical protein
MASNKIAPDEEFGGKAPAMVALWRKGDRCGIFAVRDCNPYWLLNRRV